MITRDDYFRNYGKAYEKEITKELEANVSRLLSVVNKFLEGYKGAVKLSSGWRPPSVNATIGGASKSKHITGEALDIRDVDLNVWKYFLANTKLARTLGLHAEDKRWTPSWVHLQIVPPKSGNLVFVPNSNPPMEPSIWDGKL